MNFRTTLILLLLISSIPLNAQNEKFKALYIYNFLKYIEWPEADRKGDIIIGVYGNAQMTKELQAVSGAQKIGNLMIKVKPVAALDDVTNCHMVYVSPSKAGMITQIETRLANLPTVVVSDFKGGIQQGSGINFVADGDKLKFEISRRNIERNGLKVGTALLNLGIEINN